MVVEGPSPELQKGVDPTKVKPIAAILDETPSLDEGLLNLAAWMAAYYHLPPGEAYLLPLPPGLLGARAKRGRSAVIKTERCVAWARASGEDERLGAKMAAALTSSGTSSAR